MSVLACPSCGLGLVREKVRYVCRRGHSFDVARDGYVNLLPPGRHPEGDSRAMLHARRAFLERGFYAPLADELAGRASGTTLDAGCGEGAYLRRIDGPRVGIDISKAAIQLAARRDPGGLYAVASVHRLPLVGGSVDTVLSVFSHRSYPEFARVLRPGGRVLLVEPGPDHLLELRRLLSDDPRMRRETAERPDLDGPLRVAEEQRLRLVLPLGRDDLANLLAMTPFALHAPAERQRDVTARDGLEVTADFVLTVLEQEKSPPLAADGLSAVAGE